MGNDKRWFVVPWGVIVVLLLVDGTLLLRPQLHHTPATRVTRTSATGTDHLYDEEQSAAVNRLLAAKLAPVPFSGTAIVVQDHHVVGQYSHGMADAAHGLKNSPNVSYEIDSVQKSLTAALVMRAIQTGRLSFNSHLSDFYPQVPGSQQVTIREMMDMTSGLVGPAMPAATAKPLSDTAVIQRAIQSIQFKPAQHGRWSYQQVNFTLLAGIVARVMHQSYANVLLQTLARPLRLQGTRMAYATATGQKSAQGYVASTPERYQHPFVVSAAAAHNELGTGQVFMTPGDLYRVESSLLDGRLLNAAEANALYGPRDTVQYSGGYYHAGMDLLYANGWGYGYETFVRITPDGKNAVIVMSNTLVPYNRLKGAIDGVVQWWLVRHHDLDTIR